MSKSKTNNKIRNAKRYIEIRDEVVVTWTTLRGKQYTKHVYTEAQINGYFNLMTKEEQTKVAKLDKRFNTIENIAVLIIQIVFSPVIILGSLAGAMQGPIRWRL